MKYMTFPSSCAFSGLANALVMQGFDTEGEQIALGIGLPFLFNFDEKTGAFQTGAALQTQDWFNLYLLEAGFQMSETHLARQDVPGFLKEGDMLGVCLKPQTKHAVVFLGHAGERLRFLNNHRLGDGEQDEVSFSALELLSRLEEVVVVGRVGAVKKRQTDRLLHLARSLEVLEVYEERLLDFLSREQMPHSLKAQRDTLFRALVLDGLAMMRLIKQEEQVARLSALQGQFVAAIQGEEPFAPGTVLNPDQLLQAFSCYRQLIRGEIARRTG